MNAQVIKVGQDFHYAPAGRSTNDGPFSGEAFRKRILVPALKASDSVVVELDDTEGYGSSFLEEAFGGLVREGYSASQLHKMLDLRSDDDALLREIWEYVDEAAKSKA